MATTGVRKGPLSGNNAVLNYIFEKKLHENLHNSKKSSTFAPAFEKSNMVVLAQLVEHRIVVPSVVGVLGKTP